MVGNLFCHKEMDWFLLLVVCEASAALSRLHGIHAGVQTALPDSRRIPWGQKGNRSAWGKKVSTVPLRTLSPEYWLLVMDQGSWTGNGRGGKGWAWEQEGGRHTGRRTDILWFRGYMHVMFDSRNDPNATALDEMLYSSARNHRSASYSNLFF